MNEKLKGLREERADAVAELERIHNSTDFDSDESKQQKFDEVQQNLTVIDNKIVREEAVENSKRNSANLEFDDPSNAPDEIKNYSFLEAMRQVSDPNEPISGLVKEMHQEAKREAQEAGVTLKGNGLLISSKVLNYQRFDVRNDMTAGTATQGGNAIATELRSFIDQLTDRLVLQQMASDTVFLTGLVGNIDWPKENDLPEMTWHGETETLSQSSPTVGIKSLSPKRAGTYVNLSNQLLRQTSPSIENRVVNQMLGAASRGLERAAINGSGDNNQPEGILNNDGISVIPIADNGGQVERKHLVDLETAVAVDNADVGSLGYITNAKVRGSLRNTKVDDGSGLFVWPHTGNELLGYQTGVTNLVPSDLTKGSGEDLSAMIYGNWNDQLIGLWGPIEVLPDPYTKATEGMTRLVMNLYADVMQVRDVSFAAIKDIDTSNS